NDVSINETSVSIPNIDEELFQLGQSTIFTSLDCKKGYWNVNIREEHRERAAFATPFGKWEPLRLSLGLSGAPQTFQRYMTYLFADMNDVTVYLDDILLHTEGEYADHWASLEKIFQRLSMANMKLSKEKMIVAKP